MTEEYRIGDQKRADLHAIRGERRFLFEIETGRSDVTGNARACAATGMTVVVLFTSNIERDKYAAQLKDLAIVLGPDELDQLNHLLNA